MTSTTKTLEAGGLHHTVFALGGGHVFGLHKHQDEVGTPFDGRSPGLDHVAFSCADRTELEKCGSRLDELGVSPEGSSTLTTGRGSRSVTRTVSAWSSSLRRPERALVPRLRRVGAGGMPKSQTEYSVCGFGVLPGSAKLPPSGTQEGAPAQCEAQSSNGRSRASSSAPASVKT